MLYKIVAEIERLYIAEAEKQVKAAGQNLLVGYKELHRYKNENGQLRQHIRDITEENGKLNETLCGLLDVLAIPDFREIFFAIARCADWRVSYSDIIRWRRRHVRPSLGRA